MIVMQGHPHVLRCSAAYIMQVCIVDRLFGPMFTNLIGRTADVLYADVLLCILLIYPLQSGRERIVCKHRKKVYNKHASGIINKGIHGIGKQQAYLKSFVKNKNLNIKIVKNIIFVIFN